MADPLLGLPGADAQTTLAQPNQNSGSNMISRISCAHRQAAAI
jgi:hypothetical protein